MVWSTLYQPWEIDDLPGMQLRAQLAVLGSEPPLPVDVQYQFLFIGYLECLDILIEQCWRDMTPL